MKKLCGVFVVVLMCVNITSADMIRGIDIDFVHIGNTGNPGDTVITNDGTTGYGTVGYNYYIGMYEVTNAQWNALGTAAGFPTGSPADAYNQGAVYTADQQPTNNISWYEAVQFCNYLTTGDKSQGVYQFSGTNSNPGAFIGIDRDAANAAYGRIYYLPTEDEWYKAAYFKPDASGYSLYSNGLDTIPGNDNGWNLFGGSYGDPWDVGTGTIEQNGTYDMIGNIYELNETIISPSARGLGGSSFAAWNDQAYYASSAYRHPGVDPHITNIDIGFRVAYSDVPEPCSVVLLSLGGLALLRKRKV